MAQLLSNLPIGANVKFGKHSVGSSAVSPIVWVVVDKNHSGYPTNSITLIAKQIIDLLAYDGVESNNPYAGKGFIDYGVSNINQWLNSSASVGSWYTAKHSTDAPPSNTNVVNNVGYQSKAGFLYNFTESERNLLLSTTIKAYVTSSSSFVSTTAKVFLPSLLELNLSSQIQDESSLLSYFGANQARCALTEQAYSNTTATKKPSSLTTNWQYWTRNAYVSYSQIYLASTSGTSTEYPNCGEIGVRPLINISGDAAVSESTDTEGCYTFSITHAPSAPSGLQIVTSPIYATKACSIKWTPSTDPNGDTVRYKVHVYYGGVESGSPVDVGTATSYTLTTVASGVTSITFGIEAFDTRGHNSTTTTINGTVRTNNAPTISGSNSDLGIKTSSFSQTYTVNDVDKESITVREYVDNMEVRAYTAALGATNTLTITGNTWLKLSNGNHTLKITATDGLDTTTRTFSFTKAVYTMVIQRTNPLTFSNKPTRLIVTVVKNIPPEATFKVEACNNGFDSSPTWEDITSSVKVGQTHVFSNSTKTASNWGINVRVTVNRNGGEGACYITEIGGNFE